MCLMKYFENSKVIKLDKCIKKIINEIIKKMNDKIEKVNVYIDNLNFLLCDCYEI